MTVEELQVIITANTQPIQSAVNDVNSTMSELSSQANNASNGLKKGFASAGKAIVNAGKTIAIGIGAGAVALATMAVKASEYCASIDDVAQRTNLSAKTVQEFKFAAEQSGIGMETIEGSAKKLTVAMGKVAEGNKEAIENFKQLGVAVKDSNGNLLSTDQVMPNVINKLADMKNVTERNALGVKLFGKSFMDMAPMLNGGAKGVEDFKKEANKLGLVLGDDAIQAGAKFDDTMVKVKSSIAMVTTVVGNKVMPIIQKMMDWTMANMPQIQAVTSVVFKAIGDAIGICANFFTTVLLPAFKSIYEFVQANMPTIKNVMSTVFDGIKVAVDKAVVVFKFLVDALVKVGSWISQNQALVTNIAIVVGSFAVAWGLVNLALGIWAIVGAIATTVTTAFGVAMAFLTSPIGLVILAIGAVIAIGVLLYKNWDTIKACAMTVFPAIWETIKGAFAGVLDFFAGIWEGIKQVFSVVADFFISVFTVAWNLVKAYIMLWVAVFKFVWDGIKLVFSVVKDVLLGFFTIAWNAIKAYIGLWVAVFQTIWNGIAKVFSVCKSVLTGFFSSAWEAIKKVFSGVGKFFDGIWTTIKNTFTSIGSVIGNAIGGAFKLVVNSIINFAENTINGFIRAINGALNMINKIPGVNVGMIGTLNIPKLARGGVVNSGQIYQAGEAGKEAIVPLEHNLGWIDGLAKKIQDKTSNNNGGNTFYVTIDAKNVQDFNGVVKVFKEISQTTRQGVLMNG